MKGKALKIIVLLSIVTVIISIIIVACDPAFFEDGCHSHIKIENNNNIDICSGINNYTYPDTTINDINPLKRGRKVAAGKTGFANGIGAAGTCIEDRFKKRGWKYISLFIFDAKYMEDNLKNEDFRINETMALLRYDLTLEDLNSLKWTVPYPPDERMKNMKMYPPYGQ